jgi:ATP-binding cassette, subfamily B, multidrug efflux pump
MRRFLTFFERIKVKFLHTSNSFDTVTTTIPTSSNLLFWVLSRRLKVRLLILFLGLFSGLLGVTSPWFQRLFIDSLHSIHSSEANILNTSIFYLVSAFLAAFGCQLIHMACRMVCVREGAIMHERISHMLYEHVLHLHPHARGNKSIGEIVSLYATDLHILCLLFDDTIPAFLLSLIPLMIAPLAVCFLLDMPVLGPVLAALGVVLLSVILAIKQAVYFTRSKGFAEQRISLVNEWLHNIKALRILGWTELFEGRIFTARINESLNRCKLVSLGSLMNSIVQVAPQFVNLIGIITLVNFADKTLTAGAVFSLFWIFGVFLMRPLRVLPWAIVSFLDALSSSRRLEAFLRLPLEESPDMKNNFLPSVAEELKEAGAIIIRGLTLKSKGRLLLSIDSLSIPAGALVGVVGEVGSGKSLFLKSLLRETWVSFDEYTIGRVNVRDVPLEQLRSFFSYVPQESFMMNATIRDNISFTYQTVASEDERILEGLKYAQFLPDLERCANGLNTELGERGVNLSGGQRQRITMARAHLIDKGIVLMDDSLSALDVHTEQRVRNQLLLGAWGERTRIITTHRLSILPCCSFIVFLSGGRIAAQGTFEDLLRESAEFRTFIGKEIFEGSNLTGTNM